MKRRKKLFLLTPIVLVFMLSFVSIDTSAAGRLYSSKFGGGSRNTVSAEGSGSEGSTESGKSAAENKQGSPEGEVENPPTSDTTETTSEPASYTPAPSYTAPQATSKPANTSDKTLDVKGENRIDCINIDNENKKARIYFHLDENTSDVQFWLKSSGGLVKLNSNPEFSDTGYKALGDTESSVHYYFVIDTKANLSGDYETQDLKGQIKTLLSDLGENDCISLFVVTEGGTSLLTEGAIYNTEDGQNSLAAALDSIEYNSADTNIYNGLYDACCQIGQNNDINSRDVVVAVSDGISIKNSVETEIEKKKDDPLYYALSEYGMAFYFIKLPESTEYTDGKEDFVSSELDAEEPIVYSENSVAELKALLDSDCYVAEVEYDNPEIAWPLFSVSFGNGESAEDSLYDSVAKYRFVSQYLNSVEPETEDASIEEASSGEASTEEVSTEEVSTEENTSENAASNIEQNDSNESGIVNLLKNKWPIFAAVLLVIVVAIIVIVKKKNN